MARPEQEMLKAWLHHIKSMTGEGRKEFAKAAGISEVNLKNTLTQASSIGTDKLLTLISRGIGLYGPAHLRMARFWLGPTPSTDVLMEFLSKIPSNSVKEATKGLYLTTEDVERTISELEAVTERLRRQR